MASEEICSSEEEGQSLISDLDEKSINRGDETPASNTRQSSKYTVEEEKIKSSSVNLMASKPFRLKPSVKSFDLKSNTTFGSSMFAKTPFSWQVGTPNLMKTKTELLQNQGIQFSNLA